MKDIFYEVNDPLAKLYAKFQVKSGIYFSHKTGKFFEVLDKKTIKPKYCCGGFGPSVSRDIFIIQHSVLEFYELVLEYEK